MHAHPSLHYSCSEQQCMHLCYGNKEDLEERARLLTVRSVKSRSVDAMQMPAPVMGSLPKLSDGTKTCSAATPLLLGVPVFILSSSTHQRLLLALQAALALQRRKAHGCGLPDGSWGRGNELPSWPSKRPSASGKNLTVCSRSALALCGAK